jgi:hypothetical protein
MLITQSILQGLWRADQPKLVITNSPITILSCNRVRGRVLVITLEMSKTFMVVAFKVESETAMDQPATTALLTGFGGNPSSLQVVDTRLIRPAGGRWHPVEEDLPGSVAAARSIAHHGYRGIYYDGS